MRQPVPSVTEADVERVVRRDYPPDRVDEVLVALKSYGQESWHREPSRVQLAILKLAAEDINALQTHLEMAKRDYRDVLAFAEYPGYFTKVPPTATSSDSAHAEVIEDDWKQYQEWLKKRES